MSESELKVKKLSEDIKEKIKQKILCFKTDLQLAKYVERLIKEQGLLVAFPTCVAQDQTISNYSPISTLFKELDYKFYCTVDFGIKTSDGDIVDTAITVSRDDKDLFLEDYRKVLKKIEKDLQEIVKERTLFIKDVTNIVDKNLKTLAWAHHIVPFCGAHTIEKNNLHGDYIAMNGSYTDQSSQLSLEGKRFTVEPHLLLLEPKLKVKYKKHEGTIVRDKYNNLDTIDLRLNVLKTNEVELYEYYSSNVLSFYEENTYTVRNKKLVRLS